MEQLTQQTLSEILSYDPITGVFYRLKITSKKSHIGDVVGCVNGRGYLTIMVNKKQYQAHRLAWLCFYGAWPENALDHINGNRSDNRIVNLRQATQSQNMSNRGIPKNNKSGFRGVSWHVSNKHWQAKIGHRGYRKHLGCFETAEEASIAYEKAAKEMNGEFFRVL